MFHITDSLCELMNSHQLSPKFLLLSEKQQDCCSCVLLLSNSDVCVCETVLVVFLAAKQRQQREDLFCWTFCCVVSEFLLPNHNTRNRQTKFLSTVNFSFFLRMCKTGKLFFFSCVLTQCFYF